MKCISFWRLGFQLSFYFFSNYFRYILLIFHLQLLDTYFLARFRDKDSNPFNVQDMWRVWGRIEVCTGCWWGSLKKKGHWGDQDVDGKIILKWIFRKLGGGVVGTGWSWLRIRTCGGHLWVR
jgi:hypothetical protein